MSGRGTVVGFTVNAQPWSPGLRRRRTSIAIVALEESADVRLTTNIVGCEPDEVHIGQQVAVRFEQHDDVWLPLFEPDRRARRRRRRRRPALPSAPAAARPTTASSTGRCSRASAGPASAAG